MPWLLHLVLTLLMVAMPTGGRFGSVALDEDHEKDRTEETTSKQVAGENRQLRPHGGSVPRVSELPNAVGIHQGFVPTLNLRAAELALRGGSERRML